MTERHRPAIVLIGYMCVGKTTIGRLLARQLGCTFYDLDWYIEERYHTTVPQIFATEGEAAFRDKERRMLHEVAEFQNIVLACGGGTPCHFDNMEYLRSVATTIYLHATPQTICHHLALSKGERPLLAGKTEDELHHFVSTQLTEREPYYKQAAHTLLIDPLETGKEVEQAVEAILQLLQENPAN